MPFPLMVLCKDIDLFGRQSRRSRPKRLDQPRRHVEEDLHLRQMRSPAHSLGNCVPHIRHFLILASNLSPVSGPASSSRDSVCVVLHSSIVIWPAVHWRHRLAGFCKLICSDWSRASGRARRRAHPRDGRPPVLFLGRKASSRRSRGRGWSRILHLFILPAV